MTLFVRYGQFPATFFTTGSHNFATVSRGHPLAESVLVSSLAIRRLVRTFHLNS